MIPAETISTINAVREAMIDAVRGLQESLSFDTLCESSPEFRRDFDQIAAILSLPHVSRPCDGEMTCAIIGSSGHGKTTVLDEMFPNLSKRGWLETDVTDTTSQALRVRFAPSDDASASDVQVSSWSADQIKHLMSREDVREQNENDGIDVSYLDTGLVVDASKATLDPQDLSEWRFSKRLELTPFASDYQVPKDLLEDRRFIRALTVKEQSAVLTTNTVVQHEGRGYNALQLRAMVGEVTLKDDYEQVLGWAGDDAEQLKKVSFVDTPGLGVGSVVKDEILRHYLGKKSHQIALDMLRRDELDIVIHLVLCGRKSAFESLWTEIEREWGRCEMDGISERIILAVNGMNIYFTNPDIRAKYEDPETTKREGDHFSATLEDNILQRMSPRGQMRPARLVFLDSQNIVDSFGSYDQFYTRHRKTMESWAEPGGPGFDTLNRLGGVQSFRENIDALSDPEDRGQGYLIKQTLDLIAEKGEAILLRKHLVRTGLVQTLTALQDLLARFYDQQGALNRAASQEALGQCLRFLSKSDLGQIETFAVKEIDPHIEGLVPGDDEEATDDWTVVAFSRLCELVKESIIDAGGKSISAPIWLEFGRVYDDLSRTWTQRWGYESTALAPPPDAAIGTRELVVHCLRTHAREILFQLLNREDDPRTDSGLRQTESDKESIADILRSLGDAAQLGASICGKHGVAL